MTSNKWANRLGAGVLGLSVVACGGDGGGGAEGDGGAEGGPATLEELTDQVGDHQDTLEDHEDRIGALEDPEPVSCSEAADYDCVADGQELIAMGLEPLYDAACEIVVGCCDADEIAVFMGGAFADADTCKDTLLDIAQTNQSPLLPPALLAQLGGGMLRQIAVSGALSLNAGFLTINEDMVDACKEEILATDCRSDDVPGATTSCAAPEQAEDSACTHIFEPAQADGEDCDPAFAGSSIFRQCEEGTVCTQAGTLGNCRPEPEAGDPCQTHSACDDFDGTLFCNQATSTCEEYRGKGDDCSYVNKDVSDAQRVLCEPGLSCDPVSETCKERCEVGYACNTDTDCPDDHRCLPGPFDGTIDSYTCQPELHGPGETCRTNQHCANGSCGYDAVRRTNVCRGETGDACQGGGGCLSGVCLGGEACGCTNDDHCADDEWCDVDNTCQPDKAATEDCDRSAQCQGWCETATNNQCINFLGEGDDCTTGLCPPTHSCVLVGAAVIPTCEPDGAEGDDCGGVNDPDCGEGLGCLDSGTCSPSPAGEGDDCDFAVSCDSDPALQLTCRNGTCMTPVGEGESCEVAACADGLDCGGDPADPRCYAIGSIEEGGHCAGLGTEYCAGGLSCVDVDGDPAICTDPLEDGDACPATATGGATLPLRCNWLHSYCHYEDAAAQAAGEGTCKARVGFGESCNPRELGSSYWYGLNEGCALGSSCEYVINGVNQGEFVCDQGHLEPGSEAYPGATWCNGN